MAQEPVTEQDVHLVEDAPPLELEKMDRPKGKDEGARYFRHPDTKQAWKVKLDLRPIETALTAIGHAPPQMAVTISAAPVNKAGDALVDGEGLPIVGETLTHTFTQDEISAPDFDIQARMDALVSDRVAAGEAMLSARKALESFVADWKSG